VYDECVLNKVTGLSYDEDALAALCQRWLIRELKLFGSQARGNARPDSDVDLMVSFDESARVSLWDFVRLKDELEAIFGKRVDLLTDQPIRNPYRRRSIERDLTVIYAA
jgi:predicted nucleotidyltransferase